MPVDDNSNNGKLTKYLQTDRKLILNKGLNGLTFGEKINLTAAKIALRGCMKDFIDFAALAITADDDAAVLKNLLSLDHEFSGLQTHSLLLTVMQNLSNPKPGNIGDVDSASSIDLPREFGDWSKIEQVCHKYARILTTAVFNKKAVSK
jgi:hypothetical protein